MTNEQLRIELGEPRGRWMSEIRRKAFIKEYGREPDYAARLHHISLIADDFRLACACTNAREHYEKFTEITTMLHLKEACE